MKRCCRVHSLSAPDRTQPQNALRNAPANGPAHLIRRKDNHCCRRLRELAIRVMRTELAGSGEHHANATPFRSTQATRAEPAASLGTPAVTRRNEGGEMRRSQHDLRIINGRRTAWPQVKGTCLRSATVSAVSGITEHAQEEAPRGRFLCIS